MSVTSALYSNSRLIAILLIVTALLQGALLLTARQSDSASTEGSGSTIPAALVAPQEIPVDPSSPALEVASSSSSITSAVPSDPPLRELEHIVARGETLSSIFTKYGAPVRGAIAAERALREISAAAAAMRVGDTLALKLNEQGEIVFLERRLRDGTLVSIEGDSAGYRSSAKKPIVHEVERSVGGVIQASFVQTARGLDVPFDVIDEVVDLFGARLEFRRELQPGDSFSILYTERRLPDGTLLEPGPIHAATISKSGTPLYAVRYVAPDATEHFFDEQGDLLGNYFLRYPLKFTRISSSFSYARFHPVLQKHRPHNGVDFAAPIGTPVRAVADGVVEIASYRGAAGKMIRIRHCDRYTTEYLHLHSIDSSVRPGSKVRRGQMIGGVGSTGLSTGPHLHFGLFDRGKYVDPMKAPLPVLSNKGVKIPADYLRIAVKNLNQQRQIMLLAENQTTIGRG